MTATVFHNPRCGTSRPVLEALRANGIAPRIIEYLKTPPDAATLPTVLATMGIPARALVRTKEATYAELCLAEPQTTEAALIAAMASHPS